VVFGLSHVGRQPVDDRIQAVFLGESGLPPPGDMGAQVGQNHAQPAHADLAADDPPGVWVQLEQYTRPAAD